MNLDNAYSVRGFSLAFHELDQNNRVSIEKIPGSGWDELLDAISELLKGMKCDFHIDEDENQAVITIAE